MMEWFDKYDGAKALSRAAGSWKCILAGKCPMTTAYGDTPEEAIANCREAASANLKRAREMPESLERLRGTEDGICLTDEDYENARERAVRYGGK